jgi:hypothetical protein
MGLWARVGAWLSPVERLVWGQDVAGSNPVAPTISFPADFNDGFQWLKFSQVDK